MNKSKKLIQDHLSYLCDQGDIDSLVSIYVHLSLLIQVLRNEQYAEVPETGEAIQPLLTFQEESGPDGSQD